MTAHFRIPDPDRTDLAQVRSDYAHAVKKRFDAADVELYPASKHDLSGRLRFDAESDTPTA